jgi:hypothetical protein
MLAGMEPVRPIAPDDGLLDVIVVRASGRLSGLLGGWEALRQKDLGESREGHVLRAQARKVRIATQPRRPAHGTPAARSDAHLRRLSGPTPTAPLTLWVSPRSSPSRPNGDRVIPLSRMDDRAS